MGEPSVASGNCKFKEKTIQKPGVTVPLSEIPEDTFFSGSDFDIFGHLGKNLALR